LIDGRAGANRDQLAAADGAPCEISSSDRATKGEISGMINDEYIANYNRARSAAEEINDIISEDSGGAAGVDQEEEDQDQDQDIQIEEEDHEVIGRSSPSEAVNDASAEDHAKLREQLRRKYSSYIWSLKQEFMKKKKQGKLPKEARASLLRWWANHYKWPYPSVSILILTRSNCIGRSITN
jgi:hypothetical protein